MPGCDAMRFELHLMNGRYYAGMERAKWLAAYRNL